MSRFLRMQVMIVSSVPIPKPAMDRLRDIAAAEGVKPIKLMRRWIEERLSEEEPPDMRRERERAKLSELIAALEAEHGPVTEEEIQRIRDTIHRAHLEQGVIADSLPWD